MPKLKILILALIIIIPSIAVIFINISAQHQKQENTVETETALFSTEPTLGQFCNIAEVQKRMFTEYWNTHGLWCFSFKQSSEVGVWTETSLDDADPKINRSNNNEFSTLTFESGNHDFNFKYPEGYTVKEQMDKGELAGFSLQRPQDGSGGNIYQFWNVYNSELGTAIERQRDNPLIKVLNYTNPQGVTAKVVMSKTLVGSSESPQAKTVDYIYYFNNPRTGDMLKIYGGGPDGGDPAVNLLIDSLSFKK